VEPSRTKRWVLSRLSAPQLKVLDVFCKRTVQIQVFLSHPGLLGKFYHPYRSISGPKQTFVFKEYNSYIKYFLRWLLIRVILDNDMIFGDGMVMRTFKHMSNSKYRNRLLELRYKIVSNGVKTK